MRVGTVGFLNAEPLVGALDPERFDVQTDHPAGVARRLLDGEVDLALVPVVVALDAGLRLLPGWCIGGKGPVRSVLLVAEQPPESWEEVVLDGASRTSVVLARLLLRHGPLATRVRPDLRFRHSAPGASAAEAHGPVAALIIGDAALQLDDRLCERVDLCEVWTDMTGLPFVFAAWATRGPLPEGAAEAVRSAGARGVEGIGERFCGSQRAYLQDAIRYPLDDEALAGLRRFAALAHKAGLVATADVVLVGPTAHTRDVPVPDVLARVLASDRPARADLLSLARNARTADLVLAAARRCPRRDAPVPIAVVVHPAAPGAAERIDDAVAIGATEVHLLGTVNDADLLRLRPGRERLSWWARGPDVDALAGAGLLGWLADGVGTFHEGVRTRLGAPSGRDAERELRAAASAGLRLRASLRLGQGEDDADRLDDLARWDDMAAQTGAVDEIAVLTATHGAPLQEDSATAVDLLRWTALARLALRHLPAVVGAPTDEGAGMSQIAALAGASAFGTWVLGPDPAGWSAELVLLRHHLDGLGEGPHRR